MRKIFVSPLYVALTVARPSTMGLISNFTFGLLDVALILELSVSLPYT